MGLPRMSTRGFPWKREEAKRAGMIPMTRERYFLDRRSRKYACAPIAAAPNSNPWTIHVFVDFDDEEEDDEQIDIKKFRDLYCGSYACRYIRSLGAAGETKVAWTSEVTLKVYFELLLWLNVFLCLKFSRRIKKNITQILI